MFKYRSRSRRKGLSLLCDRWTSHCSPHTLSCSLQIIFEAIRGPTLRSDIAIDDIHFKRGPCEGGSDPREEEVDVSAGSGLRGNISSPLQISATSRRTPASRSISTRSRTETGSQDLQPPSCHLSFTSPSLFSLFFLVLLSLSWNCYDTPRDGRTSSNHTSFSRLSNTRPHPPC